ncbi:MAG: hypothetical protein AB4911_15475 [Oscillochloridaceae bacterium umkhey_bin13]
MLTLGHLSVRQWAQLTSLVLLLAVSIVIVVAVVVPTAALALGLALVAASLVTLVQRTRGMARRVARRATGTAETTGPYGPTLRLDLPTGDLTAARQIRLAHASEHTLLLTRHGYVVADAAGRPIHIISQEKTV